MFQEIYKVQKFINIVRDLERLRRLAHILRGR